MAGHLDGLHGWASGTGRVELYSLIRGDELDTSYLDIVPRNTDIYWLRCTFLGRPAEPAMRSHAAA